MRTMCYVEDRHPQSAVKGHDMGEHSIETLRADAEQVLAKVCQERDELRLKLHLARAEVREEWEKLEPRFAHLEARVREVSASASDATRDVGAALGLLGEELRHGYARIRKAMQS